MLSERIRQLRESLGLSQTAFGSRLGVSRDVVNNLERGRVEIKEHVVKLICSEYHVSEDWLRTGSGPIYNEHEAFSLDQFAREHGATQLELEIIKVYFELDPAIRRAVIDHFRAHFAADPDEVEAEAFKQEYLREKRAGAGSSATDVVAGEKSTG